jgi:cellulose synthase/poly-beta-1,6-N-acetylglucosamine synthase-like glycosyltransferase
MTSLVGVGLPQPQRVRRAKRPTLVPLPDAASARVTVTRTQRIVIRAILIAAVLGLIVATVPVLIALVTLATVVYFATLAYRARIFWRALVAPELIHVSDHDARNVWDRALPTYTVLVPAYREPEVIGNLVRALSDLDYPRDRLDVKLLLEEDDTPTIHAALDALQQAGGGDHLEIVIVPPSEPRTKPKACNYGLALARGRLVTIYDAEDRPEPLQLRRAVVAFRRHPEIACLQAQLVYDNPGQNAITRWFTIEYAMWFSQFLPGLMADAAPLPLGGTSNHFRRPVLDSLGGWDPYNVTEDADLGVRLHRGSHRTGVLDSTTFEEANSDFVNWVKQRSRWYKGYLQTWLLHMRNPRQLVREIGLGGALQFNLFVGGTPLLAMINPIFWAITAAWFLGKPEIVQQLFPAWLYYISLISLVLGNVAFLFANLIAARQSGRPELVFWALLSPIYWVMMSVAAVKALIQLVVAPSYWEKTAHGLGPNRHAAG